MTTITSKELRKGDKVKLKNGSTATIINNVNSNARAISVPLFYDPSQQEIGTCYVWDIVYRINTDGTISGLTFTDKQLKAKAMVQAFGF